MRIRYAAGIYIAVALFILAGNTPPSDGDERIFVSWSISDEGTGMAVTRTPKSLLMTNTAFAWLALATCLLLLVPLIAMQFTSEVNWSVMDFVVMGALLMGSGSLYVLIARRVPPRRRLVMGLLFAVAVLYIWTELAVGVFTNLGR